jgi:hypothetical protein
MLSDQNESTYPNRPEHHVVDRLSWLGWVILVPGPNGLSMQ